MADVQQVVRDVYQINMGMVNAYLLAAEQDLVLIDTGRPGREGELLNAVRKMGKQPADISRILVTHLHADHTGNLAALKAATGAPASMHGEDARLVEQGVSSRPCQPAPGLLNWLFVRIMMPLFTSSGVEPAVIEEELQDGDVLDIARGLEVIHVPGHAAGQVAFLWREQGGVLFAADAAANRGGLGYPPLFEDQELALASLRKLAGIDFSTACFGHGAPLLEGADRAFRKKWGQSDVR